ncbi:hypothetical protein EI94DRAFT_1705910 [Lactarius quietus]|nr:hypothetical protein EI94DRAFT_1705910 [Lactarius quietus]
MFTKTILVLSLAAFSLAVPVAQPQGGLGTGDVTGSVAPGGPALGGLPDPAIPDPAPPPPILFPPLMVSDCDEGRDRLVILSHNGRAASEALMSRANGTYADKTPSPQLIRISCYAMSLTTRLSLQLAVNREWASRCPMVYLQFPIARGE